MFGFKKKVLPEDAQYVLDIVSKYSSSREIKKLISPISDEYFLIDDDNEVSLCISNENVMISNHKFLYRKAFNIAFTDRLKKLVRENMELEMQVLKKSLFENETHLLSKISTLATKKDAPQIIKPNFKSM